MVHRKQAAHLRYVKLFVLLEYVRHEVLGGVWIDYNSVLEFPPMEQVRIKLVSKRPSRCCGAPAIIVRSREGGMVSQGCTKCNAPDYVRPSDFPDTKCYTCEEPNTQDLLILLSPHLANSRPGRSHPALCEFVTTPNAHVLADS